MQPFVMIVTLIDVRPEGRRLVFLIKKLLLVRQAKRGNHEAFIKLIQDYEGVLYNTAYRFLRNEEDVADVLQETIMIAFEKIKQVKDNRYFNTWLCKILINQCQKVLRNRQFFYELDDVTIEVKEKESNKLFLDDLLINLDEPHSIVLMLYYYQGFSIKEISKILDEPVGTIKSRLSRGRQQLKDKKLKEELRHE